MAAICCVCTMLIPVPIPGGMGYINIGDVTVALAGVFCGPLFGFFAAGIGSALADLFAGYVVYAPVTFIVKGLMAMTVAFVIKTNVKYMVVPGVFSAEAEMIGGYFIFEYFLYGNEPAVAGVMGNLVQGAACLVISSVLIYIVTANKRFRGLTAI